MVYERNERRARMVGHIHSTWKTVVSIGVGAAIVLVLAWTFNNARLPGIDITQTPDSSPAVQAEETPTPVPTVSPDPSIPQPPASGPMKMVSPDGLWSAQITTVDEGAGTQRENLQIFKMENDWVPAGTVWEEGATSEEEQRPVMKGFDLDSRYLYYSFPTYETGCAFFDRSQAGWQRYDLNSGQMDTFGLPAGYEHSLSPDYRKLAYVVQEPELALIVRDLRNQQETSIHLHLEQLIGSEVSLGEKKAAGGVVWSPDGNRLVLSVSNGSRCEGKATFALVRVNLASRQVSPLAASEHLVVTQAWDPSGKILVWYANGETRWLTVNTGMVTTPPAPVVAPTSPPTEEEMRQSVLAQEPVILESKFSPDGAWEAVVLRYDCLSLGENLENALERLILRRSNGQEERILEEQLLYCGGKGSYGIGNLVWAADSRYLYYTSHWDSLPGGYGVCLWQRPVTRLDVDTGERLELAYGTESPDRDRWIFMEGDELIIWDYNAGEIDRITSLSEGAIFLFFDWMPNGQELVYILGSEPCYPYYAQYMGSVDLSTKHHSLLVEGTLEDHFSIVQNGQGILYRTFDNHEFPHGEHALFYLEYQTRQSHRLAYASLDLRYRLLEGRSQIVYWVNDTSEIYPQGFERLAHLNLDHMQERILAEGVSLSFEISSKLGVLVYREAETKGHSLPNTYSLNIVDLVSFSQTFLLEGEGTADFSISPDGNLLAVLEVEWGRSSEGKPFEINNSRLTLIDLPTGRVSELMNSSDPVFEYVTWVDNDTLSLGWEGWRYSIPTGELWKE
jgi:hypothetical protein